MISSIHPTWFLYDICLIRIEYISRSVCLIIKRCLKHIFLYVICIILRYLISDQTSGILELLIVRLDVNCVGMLIVSYLFFSN